MSAHGTRGKARTVRGGDATGNRRHRGDIKLRIRCSEGKSSNFGDGIQYFVTGLCVKTKGWNQHSVTGI